MGAKTKLHSSNLALPLAHLVEKIDSGKSCSHAITSWFCLTPSNSWALSISSVSISSVHCCICYCLLCPSLSSALPDPTQLPGLQHGIPGWFGWEGTSKPIPGHGQGHLPLAQGFSPLLHVTFTQSEYQLIIYCQGHSAAPSSWKCEGSKWRILIEFLLLTVFCHQRTWCNSL